MATSSQKKLVIFGGGAVGLSLASRLAPLPGLSVRLYARGLTRERILAKGFLVTDGGQKTVRADICEDLHEITSDTLVLICTKAYDLKSVLDELSFGAAEWPVLYLWQNGFDLKHLVLDWLKNKGNHVSDRVVRVVTTLGAGKITPAEVVIHSWGRTFIEGIEHGEELQQILQRGNIPCEVTAHIQQREAQKGVLNSVINPLTAIHGVSNGELLRAPQLLALLPGLMREDIEILKTRGLDMDYESLFSVLQGVLQATAANTSSMLGDLRAGRQTEIDFLNGKLLQWAETADLRVPLNRGLYTELCNKLSGV